MTGPSRARGLIIAAPSTGSGKTVITTGLIAAWRAAGVHVAAAKAGPDYIDAAFLAAAAGGLAVNLDCWAMRPGLLRQLALAHAAGADLLILEGVMGLFDGGSDGAGSTADLAKALGLPAVLVIDASRQAQSAAVLAHGFATFDEHVEIAGVILNRVAGERHASLLRGAFKAAGIEIFGIIPPDAALDLPSRHLGLVQAGENASLDQVIGLAAQLASTHIDLERLVAAARALAATDTKQATPLPPPGQRIAVAHDQAFAFFYDHVLAGWRAKGAEVSRFSPLGDEAPDPSADAVILPGGYPELHAGRLSANDTFLTGLRSAADSGALIYGECGGYMVLGEGLVDADGIRHRMAGLLALETSFAEPRRTLGYRRAIAGAGQPLVEAGTVFRCHEFHYAHALHEAGTPLFSITGMQGEDLDQAGLTKAHVAGSFMHVIDTE